MKLSELIIAYREEHELSQRQFAELCGLSNGYISMIENNSNPKTGQAPELSMRSLKKIADVLGMPLNTLLNVVNDMVVDITEGNYDDVTETPTIEDSRRNNEFIELFGQLPEDHQMRIIREIKGILSGQ